MQAISVGQNVIGGDPLALKNTGERLCSRTGALPPMPPDPFGEMAGSNLLKGFNEGASRDAISKASLVAPAMQSQNGSLCTA